MINCIINCIQYNNGKPPFDFEFKRSEVKVTDQGSLHLLTYLFLMITPVWIDYCIQMPLMYHSSLREDSGAIDFGVKRSKGKGDG